MTRYADYRVLSTLHEDSVTRVLRVELAGGEGSAVVKTTSAEHPSASHRARLRREHQVLQRLSKARVAGVPKPLAMLDGASPRLVLADSGGRTLKDVLASDPLDLQDALRIAARTAEILSAVHRHRVVHKDLKPSNILVSDDGAVCLLDFGIASSLDSEAASRNPGKLEGTLAYMPPEQTGRINRPVDARSDLYSLGVTLYQALTGAVPFKERDPMEIVHGHIARRPKAPHEVNPDIPRAVSDVIMRLLEKDASARYQSGRGLAADLDRCLRELADTGSVRPFPLGAQDHPERFMPSHRLYGRQRSLESLRRALGRGAGGSQELVLVYGYSGIGKTSLVEELHSAVLERRGRFIEGKFNQYERTTPYTAVAQAFTGLVRQLLTLGETQVAPWRHRILEAVGDLGAVIIAVIPEVEHLLGPQPAVPELEADAARNRFNRVFLRFTEAVASPDTPLVLFLDDLQWADQASLDLLRLFATRPEVRHLTVVGAYRDNEVDQAHPLAVELARIRQERAAGTIAPITHVELQGLALDDVAALISDSVRRPVDEVRPLAALVHEKTAGNPFFVHQFLRTLHERGHLAMGERGWAWDIDAIRGEGITDNVVELLTARIRNLDSHAQHILRLAACLGAGFDFDTLVRVAPLSRDEVARGLWPSVSQGLVVPAESGYGPGTPEEGTNPTFRFQHDRVQQAAYGLLGETERGRTHLRIGRLLMDAPASEDDRQFDVASHFMRGIDFIDDEGEQRRVAGHLAAAGRRAKREAAYKPAIPQLRAARRLLGHALWTDAYEVGTQVISDLATCEYMVGNVDQADRLFAEVFQHARTDAERAQSFVLRVQLRIGRSQVPEALGLAVEGLTFCGESLELRPTQEQVGAAIGALTEAIGGRTFEELAALPEATDPLKVAALDILNATAAPAYYVDENLYALIIVKMCTLSARYGQAPVSPFGWALYGVVAGPILGNFEDCANSAACARAVQRRFQRIEMVPKLALCLAGFVDHWTRPPLDGMEELTDGARAGLDAGDPVFAAFCAAAMGYLWIMTGLELPELEKQAIRWRAFCENLGIAELPDALEVHRRLALALTGRTASPKRLGDDEDEWLAALDRYTLRIPLHMALLAKMELAWLAGDLGLGRSLIPRSAELEPRSIGTGHSSMHAWLASLHLASSLLRGEGGDAAALRRQLDGHLERLRAWRAANEFSFAHKVLVIEAALAELDGDVLGAMRLYRQAAEEAESRGCFVKNAGIIYELAAGLYQRLGEVKPAWAYLREARAAYERWGARTKVAALDAAHPGLAPRHRGRSISVTGTTASTATAISTNLDTISLVKASQAISSAIRLQDLTGTLMEILLQNTGAQRAIFLLCEGDALVTYGERRFGESSFQPDPRPFTERDDLARGVIHYVQRREEPVVLPDLSDPGHFASDPYIQRQATAAILCAPVRHKNELKAIVYLENALTPGAFTEERFELVRILTSQLAISIENAALYQSAERQARAFERFVPREFLDLLGVPSPSEVQLGDAVLRHMAVMFTDIRSYTTISESMTPERNFAFVNEYLSYIGPEVRAQGGFIDKYLGDGVMALFPSPQRAVAAAARIGEKLDQLNDMRRRRGEFPIRIGGGVHAGDLMLGVVGEAERLDGTVLADAVNVAARLERLCKTFGARMLVSAEVLDACPNHARLPHRLLGPVAVEGRREPLRVYELLATEREAEIRLKVRTRDLFESAVASLEQGDRSEAIRRLGQVLDTNPSDGAARALLQYAQTDGGMPGAPRTITVPGAER